MTECKLPTVRVSKLSEITVYPQFCRVGDSTSLPSSIYLCQDDRNGVAFIDEDARKKFIRQLYNQNQEEAKTKSEKLRLRQKELQRRRCKK